VLYSRDGSQKIAYFEIGQIFVLNAQMFE